LSVQKNISIKPRKHALEPADAVKIRRAGENDAAQIAELSGQLGYPATAKQIVKRLREMKPRGKHAVFVAEDSRGEVIGWVHASLEPLLEVGLRTEINGLVVADGQRNHGAGARLLSEAEKWSRQQGSRNISVRSNVVRERAHVFYERHGYEHYKTQKAFRKSL
jgi:GNAT superfamily N-acetyltransferase